MEIHRSHSRSCQWQTKLSPTPVPYPWWRGHFGDKNDNFEKKKTELSILSDRFWRISIRIYIEILQNRSDKIDNAPRWSFFCDYPTPVPYPWWGGVLLATRMTILVCQKKIDRMTYGFVCFFRSSQANLVSARHFRKPARILDGKKSAWSA